MYIHSEVLLCQQIKFFSTRLIQKKLIIQIMTEINTIHLFTCKITCLQLIVLF